MTAPTFLEEIAAFAEQVGLGTRGSSLFLEKMPAITTTAVMFRSPIRGVSITQGLPGYRRSGFQMVVREASEADGRILCEKAINLLSVRQVDFGRFYVRFFWPKSEAIPYPRGLSGLIEHSVMFDACYSDPDAIV